MGSIVNAHRIDFRGRTLIYAEPQFIKVAQQWTGIDAAVKVSEDNEAYLVQLGDDWIRFEPASVADRNQIAKAKKYSVVTTRQFGPILDCGKLTADSLGFRVSFSSNVERTTKGWKFTNVKEADLGVWLTGWQALLKDGLTVVGDELAVDVSSYRTAKAILDLDPSIIMPTAQYRHDFAELNRDTEQEAWDAAHDAAASDTQTSGNSNVQARTVTGAGPPDAYIKRAAVRFDTRGLSPSEAYLKATKNTATADAELWCCRFDPNTPAELGNSAVYKDIWDDEAGDNRGGFANAYGQIGEMTLTNGVYVSTDLVAASKWLVHTRYNLGMVEEHDYSDTLPGGNDYAITITGSPWLDLIFPKHPGGSLSVSTAVKGR